MLHKKSILVAVIFAAFSMNVIPMASAEVYGVPSMSDSFFSTIGAGFVVGVQGGYVDEHWNALQNTSNLLDTGTNMNVNDTGPAARGFIGYDFNKYLGLEAGYTYLPKNKVTGNGFNGDVKNYAIDLLAKLSVPVTDVFSLYAKAGGSYLNSNVQVNSIGANALVVPGSVTHIGPAYGIGAAYEVVPNLAIDLSWMRFSGQTRLVNQYGNSTFETDPDAILLGVSYKFPVSYS